MADITIAALIRKRAEMAGEIEALDATLSQLRADLMHLDAVIRIMSQDINPEAIRPKKPSRKGCEWFGQGELARMVLDVLREAQGPLAHAEIARGTMEGKRLPGPRRGSQAHGRHGEAAMQRRPGRAVAPAA